MQNLTSQLVSSITLYVLCCTDRLLHSTLASGILAMTDQIPSKLPLGTTV